MNESRPENRLRDETSPYLLQHAHNPVDWHPWGPDALDLARAQDKPILLSIGYAACHWCHVMERESFENDEIAALMNDNFVCIKVDREERPDLDDIYMTAVQMMSGHGGWPLTVFLTPGLRPFFGGTYFPPEDRAGMPGFRRVLAAVRRSFDEERESVEEMSTEVAAPSSRIRSMPSAWNRKLTSVQSLGALPVKSKSMPITGGKSMSTTLTCNSPNPAPTG